MLKVLLRSRMEALLSVLTGAGRTKKAQSKGKLIGFATLMLLSLFSLGTLFARIFEVLAQPLAMLDMGWRPPCTPTHSPGTGGQCGWPS